MLCSRNTCLFTACPVLLDLNYTSPSSYIPATFNSKAALGALCDCACVLAAIQRIGARIRVKGGGAERTCVDCLLAVMAEMVGSAFVQEAVSRAVSFVLGKREEAASQGHMMERLEMAANHLEYALERSKKLPILDVSLLQRRKTIKCAYVQAMELLERHNRQQQAVLPAAGGQEDHPLVSRGKKRKLWMIFGANKQNVVPVAPSSSSGGLDTADVQRFEQFADWGRELVRDVDSACSLLRNNLCSNPIVRHLFEGRSLWCRLVQGNQRRTVLVLPSRSEERGLC
ncbi:hypothetical protein U9M48_011532 [Paspalum notatum var. saurae]|uniref:Uncharacterized protein n=1 Tax=Paspalum notatum var. saurae TaxID=547442 RepID=A0AAQ3SW12_PASNO